MKKNTFFSEYTDGILPQNTLHRAQKRLLQLHFESKLGHLGGNISALNIIMTLFHCHFKPEDRFILSKGHAAGALYISLWSTGLLSEEDLKTFCKDGSVLPGHPHPFSAPQLRHRTSHTGIRLESMIPFPTGSLGHGPSLASGLALAARAAKSRRRIWCLCGDGEWQEGACWEALTFAMSHKLDNLTLLIDRNHLQGFGTTEAIAGYDDFAAPFAAFGIAPFTCDGHSPLTISQALLAEQNPLPRVIICETVKGRGLSTENQVASHYLPITPDEYQNILENPHA